jgi:hypothetical protein
VASRRRRLRCFKGAIATKVRLKNFGTESVPRANVMLVAFGRRWSGG